MIDPKEKADQNGSLDCKKSLLSNWPLMSSIILYCVFSFHDMAYTEVYCSCYYLWMVCYCFAYKLLAHVVYTQLITRNNMHFSRQRAMFSMILYRNICQNIQAYNDNNKVYDDYTGLIYYLVTDDAILKTGAK